MKRVLILDDFEVVRKGVKSILFESAESKDTYIFGEASTAADPMSLVRGQDWDLVTLDLSLGGRSGLEFLKELKHLRPRLPILVLSMHCEEQYLRRAFNVGATG